MKNILTVIGFTIKDMVGRKSYIISTIVILLMIVIGFNVPKLIEKYEEAKKEENEKQILIVDADNVYKNSLENINNMELEYSFEILNEYKDKEQIKKDFEEEKYDEAIVISEENNKVNLEYIVETKGTFTRLDPTIENILKTLYTNLKVGELGIPEEKVQVLSPKFEVIIEQTADKEVKVNNFLMMICSLVLFLAIYFNVYQVSTSITIEKTSKIIETLVTSTKPSVIVIGKTIGAGIAGVVQLAILVVTALISANIFLEPEMLEAVLDTAGITPYLIMVMAIYFILGYFMYAFMYAITGSAVSKPEEIQSANTPVAIITVIGFYLSYFTMMNPNSSLNEIAGIVPISSPFCMPFRVMMGLAEPTDVMISVGVLSLTMIIIAKIAINIYSSAILQGSVKLNLKNIIRMYKEK